MNQDQNAVGSARRVCGGPSPMTPAERIPAIDVLRGLALGGILVVNVYYHGHPYFLDYLTFLKYQGLDPADHRLDRLVHGIITTLCQESFYCLFAFLFAFGFATLTDRCEAAGASARAVTLRRLAVLALLGLAHVVLVWAGDILITYALLGLALPLLRRLTDRALIAGSAAGLAIGSLLLAGALVAASMTGGPGTVAAAPATRPADGPADDGLATRHTLEPASEAPAEPSRPPEAARQWDDLMRRWHRHTVEVYASGGFRRIALHRLVDYAIWTASIAAFQYPRVLGMYALGVLAARRRLLQEPQRHLRFLRRATGWAMAAAVAGSLPALGAGLAEAPDHHPGRALLLLAGDAVRIPALALFLVGGVLLACRSPRTGRWLGWLAPAGRMSLSGYLGQSLVCSLVFCGYGLGMYGHIGPARGALLAAAIFAVQLPLCALWLRIFRYGPVEWVLRTAAYGRALPMRPA